MQSQKPAENQMLVPTLRVLVSRLNSSGGDRALTDPLRCVPPNRDENLVRRFVSDFLDIHIEQVCRSDSPDFELESKEVSIEMLLYERIFKRKETIQKIES